MDGAVRLITILIGKHLLAKQRVRVSCSLSQSKFGVRVPSSRPDLPEPLFVVVAHPIRLYLTKIHADARCY
jgi:hypothetical protein